MGLLGKAVEKPPRELIPVGEYVFTLWDMVIDNGQWGEQIKWIWLVSPISDPDNYLKLGNGQEKEVWQFTKPSLARGSKAWMWSEALLGRSLRINEEPDDTDLIRRRMIGMLIHKGKRNDPSDKNEAISDEIPPRPFRATQPVASRQAPPSDPVEQFTADGDHTSSDPEREKLYEDIRKALKNAQLADIDTGEYEAMDLVQLDEDGLYALLAGIKKAIRQAA